MTYANFFALVDGPQQFAQFLFHRPAVRNFCPNFRHYHQIPLAQQQKPLQAKTLADTPLPAVSSDRAAMLFADSHPKPALRQIVGPVNDLNESAGFPPSFLIRLLVIMRFQDAQAFRETVSHHTFLRDQFLAPFVPAPFQHQTSILGFHTGPEAVNLGPFPVVRSKSRLHNLYHSSLLLSLLTVSLFPAVISASKNGQNAIPLYSTPLFRVSILIQWLLQILFFPAHIILYRPFLSTEETTFPEVRPALTQTQQTGGRFCRPGLQAHPAVQGPHLPLRGYSGFPCQTDCPSGAHLSWPLASPLFKRNFSVLRFLRGLVVARTFSNNCQLKEKNHFKTAS